MRRSAKFQYARNGGMKPEGRVRYFYFSCGEASDWLDRAVKAPQAEQSHAAAVDGRIREVEEAKWSTYLTATKESSGEVRASKTPL